MCSASSGRGADGIAAPGQGAPLQPHPPWVRWIAQDRSGAWWGYSVEPLRHDSGWYENEVGRCVFLGRGEPRGWERSLRAVPPAQR